MYHPYLKGNPFELKSFRIPAWRAGLMTTKPEIKGNKSGQCREARRQLSGKRRYVWNHNDTRESWATGNRIDFCPDSYPSMWNPRTRLKVEKGHVNLIRFSLVTASNIKSTMIFIISFVSAGLYGSVLCLQQIDCFLKENGCRSSRVLHRETRFCLFFLMQRPFKLSSKTFCPSFRFVSFPNS